MIKLMSVVALIGAVVCFAPIPKSTKSNVSLKQIHTDMFQIDRNAVAKADRAWFVEMVN